MSNVVKHFEIEKKRLYVSLPTMHQTRRAR